MELLVVLLLAALVIHFPRKDGPARIKRRDGGCPVVDVTFNDDQAEEMIVDTGCSRTTITQKMAKNLGVRTIGKSRAQIANGDTIEFDVAVVDSIEVGGVKAKEVIVGIAPDKLDIGLLGQNFYGKYDVNIKRDVVEFNESVDA
ncbi:retropepsin-like aspartic protease family protein [Calothrix sp. 336/3]|uniref:retropepsin-like aspartic protease family protein n=1 Tax=Calothrix sp. 336/3 TaxID=1337936 RepID=UPI00069A57C1|nr:retropepsin-like aspartic protease [Calothrix sp. 336/3]